MRPLRSPENSPAAERQRDNAGGRPAGNKQRDEHRFGSRLHFGMAADIKSEWWPESIGISSRIESEFEILCYCKLA